MHRGFSIIYIFIILAGSASSAMATPTPYGETGLLTQPTAETLSAGNICVGIWVNHAEFSDQGATIVPTAITLGLGTFLEAYGSYPNLLANGEESESGRGFANIGLKMKVWGGRSAPFKLAVDGQLRKSVSDNPALDGINSLSTRLIASFKSRRFGIHANGGYVTNENPPTLAGGYNDQYVFGGGVELYPSERFRVIAEMESQSKLIDSMEGQQEAMLGVQYFVSPHLTFNLGAGIGLSDASPDYRGLVGFSTCQGIGSYQKPIPTIAPVEEEAAEEEKEPVKVIKVRTLTPLATRTAPKPVEPVGQFEIPVESPGEEVVLPPGERLLVPGTNRLLAAPIVPIQPLMAVAPIASVPEESAAIAANTSESTIKPIQQPAPTVETLPVAEAVPGEVASEGPGVSSPVAAVTSLGKTAVVAAAPVVSVPVAVVEAPGAAVNTPIVTPAPVMAAPAAVVEPIASPDPVVEVLSAPLEPIAAAASGPTAAAPETTIEPIQQPAPAVETLPVAEAVPGEVASEGPGVSSPVAAAASLGKTAVVAAAPVVSVPVAVVAAPGAAVNTPIVTPAPVMAAPAAVVEPIASPDPVVEVLSAPLEPIAAAASGPIAAAPETTIKPIQQPAPAVETLPVAEAVPGEVASEGPGVSSPVAAVTSLGKTAVVAAAPVVSVPVAVVAAPGAAVNTPIVTPAPVNSAPVAVVEPIASPAPVVEVATAASGPIAASTSVAIDLPVPAGETPVGSSPLPATATTPRIGSLPTEIAVVTSNAPALSIPVGTEVSGVPFEAMSTTAIAAGLEVVAESAPTEVAPAPAIQVTPAVAEQSIEAVVYRKFRLQEVTFGTNQWKVSQEGMAALAMVAEQLRKENKEFLLRVDGHTDSLGSNNYNDKLSLQRSITIATNMVVHNGFDPARLFVKGFGESKPIATNESEEGKAKNRRVEILVLLPKKVPVQ